MPKGFSWGKQWAVREERKERANNGGIIMGIRKERTEINVKMDVDTEEMIVGEIKIGEDEWRIIGIYVSKRIEMMKRNVERWMKGKEKDRRILVGGDFNAKVGKGEGVEGEERINRERRSKDGVVNGEG